MLIWVLYDAGVFGLGFWEIAAILVVGLLVLGPSKLPELARSLGKGLREFRKATDDFRSTVEEEVRKPEAPKPLAAETEAEVLPASTEEANDAALAGAEAEKAAAAVAAASADPSDPAPEVTPEPSPTDADSEAKSGDA